ncbi:MAG: DMT family transporter, partial [Hydrogenimonas sp.]|nr:DMT family transporter [Hydrogenimonas sp.]
MRQRIHALNSIDKGIIFMLASAFISALNGAIAKILGDDLSAMEIVFFRNLIGVAIIVITLRHTPAKLPGGKVHLLLLRGLFGFAAMILFFYTITVIPLAEAITLNKTSPLFVAILAFFLMKERLNIYSIAALIIGFSGVVFIAKPTGISMGYEHFLGLLGGFFAACAYATIKRIRDIYDARL